MRPLMGHLGPVLLLIYVNDMSSAESNKVLLYADDAAILVSVLESELDVDSD